MIGILKINDDAQLISVLEDIEIGVVTALQSELDALIRLADKNERISCSRTYHKLTFNHSGKKFAVIAYSLGHMGIASMAISLMEMINTFKKLKYLSLIGIAAGSNSKEQDYGDLLIPETIYNYESGKYSESKNRIPFLKNKIEFVSDKKSHDIDVEIIQKIKAVTADESILEEIQRSWPLEKSSKLKPHYGNFACGSSVIASKLKINEISDSISRKYIGLDMETFALAAINQLRVGREPKLFIIKSITDFADTQKDDSEHEYAKYTAAKFFIAVCGEILV